ncbi:peptide methionine sulfoxide [Diplocarpon rosae]|nr:peptide methionine sulfoxide [Diplocarpon rosae]
MPAFMNRLMRPFTTSTRLGLGGGDAAPISSPDGAHKATIAAGCFWGVEHMFRKEFTGKGLYDARVGYIGGDAANPSYRAVCSGRTGRKRSFLFFSTTRNLWVVAVRMVLKSNNRCRSPASNLRPCESHIPTTPRVLLQDARPDDVEPPGQYRSGIFYHNAEQESVAREVTKLVNEKWWKGKVVTLSEELPATGLKLRRTICVFIRSCMVFINGPNLR